MKNPIQPIIDGLDARKKTGESKRYEKLSKYSTPGPMETEIMLLGMGNTRGDKKTALEALKLIKDGLKK